MTEMEEGSRHAPLCLFEAHPTEGTHSAYEGAVEYHGQNGRLISLRSEQDGK